MSEAKNKIKSNYSVKVIESSKQCEVVSANDLEMDARAIKAVQVAIEKAKFCKKPVARYDLKTKKAYVEYSNGTKKYVE